MAADETTLYEKGTVKITSARAVMGANTYPIAGLTHVSLQRGNGDYYVRLGGSGSIWTGYRSPNRAEIQGIVEALNTARAAHPIPVVPNPTLNAMAGVIGKVSGLMVIAGLAIIGALVLWFVYSAVLFPR